MGAFTYFFFRGKQIKLGTTPAQFQSHSLPVLLSSPHFHSVSAMKHKKFPGEMRTGKQRQREETASEAGAGDWVGGLGERVLVS